MKGPELLKSLVRLASDLDAAGEFGAADAVDALSTELAASSGSGYSWDYEGFGGTLTRLSDGWDVYLMGDEAAEFDEAWDNAPNEEMQGYLASQYDSVMDSGNVDNDPDHADWLARVRKRLGVNPEGTGVLSEGQ